MGSKESQASMTRVFQRHLTGVYSSDTIESLKYWLYTAGLLESPYEEIETVLVEDLDHFFDLLGEHGVPLARSLKPDAD